MTSTFNQIVLREYQINAVNDIHNAISEKKNSIIQLPTGTGKTTVIAQLIKEWRFNAGANQRALIVVHRIELVDQIIERCLSFGINVGKIKSGEPVDFNCRIYVGLIQSLKDKRRPGTLGLIIIDEAHHTNAKSYLDLIDYYNSYSPVVIGVSATPSRLDGKSLGDTYKQIFSYGQIKQFIDEGYLTSMKHYATAAPNLKFIKISSAGDYEEKALMTEMSRDLIMANLVEGYKKHASGKKMIVFAVNVGHAELIANRYTKLGFKAASLNYKTDPTTRQRTIDKFKSGEILILCNVNLFTEGFDCPDVEVIQLARPTKSLNLYLQMVGRGMRPFPNKESGIILDNAKLWEEHGLSTRDRIWDIYGLKKINVKYKIHDEDGQLNESIERENSIPEETKDLELIEIVEEGSISSEKELIDDIVIDSTEGYLQLHKPPLTNSEESIPTNSLNLEAPNVQQLRRLAKVASEMNRSFQVLADVLNQRGFAVMPKPTTKITEDMYQALIMEFSKEKAARDRSNLLKLKSQNDITEIAKPDPPRDKKGRRISKEQAQKRKRK